MIPDRFRDFTISFLSQVKVKQREQQNCTFVDCLLHEIETNHNNVIVIPFIPLGSSD